LAPAEKVPEDPNAEAWAAPPNALELPELPNSPPEELVPKVEAAPPNGFLPELSELADPPRPPKNPPPPLLVPPPKMEPETG